MDVFNKIFGIRKIIFKLILLFCRKNTRKKLKSRVGSNAVKVNSFFFIRHLSTYRACNL